MLRKVVSTSCVLAALASASLASADAALAPGLTFTARSGVAGTSTTEIGAASDVNAVSSISVAERFDDPCWLRAGKAEINNAGTSLSDDFDQCTTTGPSQNAGWLNNSGIYAYGISVCTNSGSDRLKGIILFGGVISSSGVLTQLGLPAIFERTNCNTWHNAVFCPAGQVATKVRVHHTGGSIRGLSLGCRTVIDD